MPVPKVTRKPSTPPTSHYIVKHIKALGKLTPQQKTNAHNSQYLNLKATFQKSCNPNSRQTASPNKPNPPTLPKTKWKSSNLQTHTSEPTHTLIQTLSQKPTTLAPYHLTKSSNTNFQHHQPYPACHPSRKLTTFHKFLSYSKLTLHSTQHKLNTQLHVILPLQNPSLNSSPCKQLPKTRGTIHTIHPLNSAKRSPSLHPKHFTYPLNIQKPPIITLSINPPHKSHAKFWLNTNLSHYFHTY